MCLCVWRCLFSMQAHALKQIGWRWGQVCVRGYWLACVFLTLAFGRQAIYQPSIKKRQPKLGTIKQSDFWCQCWGGSISAWHAISGKSKEGSIVKAEKHRRTHIFLKAHTWFCITMHTPTCFFVCFLLLGGGVFPAGKFAENYIKKYICMNESLYKVYFRQKGFIQYSFTCLFIIFVSNLNIWSTIKAIKWEESINSVKFWLCSFLLFFCLFFLLVFLNWFEGDDNKASLPSGVYDHLKSTDRKLLFHQ